jgi:putative salt-induced outer membrane protein YdiY
MELGMRKSIVAMVITLAISASAAARAQDSWSTRSELGFVASRGNTSAETGNA